MVMSRIQQIKRYTCITQVVNIKLFITKCVHFVLQGSNIFDQLSGLSSRGVKLRIVQNPPDSVYHDLDTQTLIEKGQAEVQNLDFTKLMSAGILHTKLWVVDKRHFYMGSANMDWRSLTQVYTST